MPGSQTSNQPGGVEKEHGGWTGGQLRVRLPVAASGWQAGLTIVILSDFLRPARTEKTEHKTRIATNFLIHHRMWHVASGMWHVVGTKDTNCISGSLFRPGQATPIGIEGVPNCAELIS